MRYSLFDRIHDWIIKQIIWWNVRKIIKRNNPEEMEQIARKLFAHIENPALREQMRKEWAEKGFDL